MGLLSTIGAASGRAFGFTRSAIAQAVSDAYFNLTTLLLPGNGTNGAQNNTFLDSSSNNFTITRNGNTTQGTFSPFSQTGWSNFFDGNGDYLGIGSNAVLSPGTGAFWIECWVNFSGFPGSNTAGAIFQNDAIGTSANDKFWFGLFNSAGTYQLTLGRHNTANKSFVNWTPTIGVWYHVAAARSGGTTYLFIDGTSQTVTNSTVFNGVSFGQNGASIGAISSPWYFNGYISNFRYIVGAALYTSTFTPATTPLTTTSQGATASQVEILTCQDNRFIDNSSNAFAITVNGNSSVQAFSPFAPTAAYSAATNGGSGYFDGTGDYLGIATGGSTLSLNGDFTVELWCYLTTTAGVRSPLANSGVASGTGTFTLVLGGGLTQLDFYIGSSSAAFGSTNLRLNEWTHIAIIRSGTGTNNVKVYKNGVFQIQQSNNSTYLLDTFAIGAYANGTNYWVGNIGQVRIVKGQALCSGDFTPPTAPVTTTSVGWTGANAASSITGTVPFLLNFTNAGITDATAKNVLETVGNAQISTTQSKFGGSSMYFDGTGDWLIVPKSWSIASGENFTIEGWFYLTAAQASFRMILSDNNGASGKYMAITATGLELQFGSTGGTTATITQTFSQNTWYHIAVVRSSNVLSMYIDGVSKTVTNATNSASFLDQGSFLYVGRWSGTSYEFVGYIDDLRITKGYARYASNFTPPTAAFPVQ